MMYLGTSNSIWTRRAKNKCEQQLQVNHNRKQHKQQNQQQGSDKWVYGDLGNQHTKCLHKDAGGKQYDD